jgi:hypothetical protein
VSLDFFNVDRTEIRIVVDHPMEHQGMQHVKLGTVVFRQMKRMLERLMGTHREIRREKDLFYMQHGS